MTSLLAADDPELGRILDESLVEAQSRGMSVCLEELSAKARHAVRQAASEGHPLTDVELLAVLATFVGNRSVTG